MFYLSSRFYSRNNNVYNIPPIYDLIYNSRRATTVLEVRKITYMKCHLAMPNDLLTSSAKLPTLVEHLFRAAKGGHGKDIFFIFRGKAWPVVPRKGVRHVACGAELC